MLKPYWGLLVKMGYSESDILHERDLAIHRAAKRFDFKNGAKVNTWIGGNVRWWCLNILKRYQKEIVKHADITENSHLQSKERFNSDQDLSSFIDKTLSELKDPKIKLVFKDRFIYNKNLKEISSKHGISASKANKMSELGRKHIKKRIQESESNSLSL